MIRIGETYQVSTVVPNSFIVEYEFAKDDIIVTKKVTYETGSSKIIPASVDEARLLNDAEAKKLSILNSDFVVFDPLDFSGEIQEEWYSDIYDIDATTKEFNDMLETTNDSDDNTSNQFEFYLMDAKGFGQPTKSYKMMNGVTVLRR